MAIYFFGITNKVIEFDNTSINFKETIKHLKDMKDSLCERDETINNDYINVDKPYYLSCLQRLQDNKENCFGFCYYQDVYLYGKKTKRPIAVLIAREANKTNSYIIMLLCRHVQGIKGLGKSLIDKLVEKAKANNITFIFVEPLVTAGEFYKKLGFGDMNKSEITESSDDASLLNYGIIVKNYNPQNGGGLVNVLYIKQNDSIKDTLKMFFQKHDIEYIDGNCDVLIVKEIGSIKGALFLDQYLSIIGNVIHASHFCFDEPSYGKLLLDAAEKVMDQNKVVKLMLMLNINQTPQIELLRECRLKEGKVLPTGQALYFIFKKQYYVDYVIRKHS